MLTVINLLSVVILVSSNLIKRCECMEVFKFNFVVELTLCDDYGDPSRELYFYVENPDLGRTLKFKHFRVGHLYTDRPVHEFSLISGGETDICSDEKCELEIYASSRSRKHQFSYRSLVVRNKDRDYPYLYRGRIGVRSCLRSRILKNDRINKECSDDYKILKTYYNSIKRPKCGLMKCDPGKYNWLHGCEQECTECHQRQCTDDGKCVMECQYPYIGGIDCKAKCITGRWGLEWKFAERGIEKLGECQHECFCQNGAPCYQLNGTCPAGCAVGYKSGCQEKCPPRKWSADGVNCDRDCECKIDEDCYNDGRCPSGPKTSCPGDSNYGPDCTKKCHCKNMESCVNDTGQCENGCDLQHYGDDCQQKCPAKRYHTNNDLIATCSGRCHCRNDQSCNATDGNCGNGCAVNYWGKACEHECNYGPDCVNGKSCHCLDDKQDCDNETGYCQCSHRWTGKDCQITCEDNFWKPPACESTCQCAQPSDCRVEDGECRGPCPLKRYGLRCDKDCKDDTTGNIRCSLKRCNCLDEDSDCDPITHECKGVCDIRYTGGYGTACEKKCGDGEHLDGSSTCSGKCHCLVLSLCNVTTGACVGQSGCDIGWVEPSCLLKCKYGGEGCDKSCNCFNNSKCNEITGACPGALCQLRHHGADCQEKCLDGKFLQHGSCSGDCHCANPGQCRATDGECMNGVCSTGWEGDHCQTHCKFGFTGDNCEKICHCKGGHRCDRFTGYCPDGCATRYHGTGCTLTCPKNHFLLGKSNQCLKQCHCLNPGKCNAETGKCLSGGCERGYKGPDCQTKCENGADKKYGKNCDHACHCAGNNTCNGKTGNCGEFGCHLRYFGYNCNDTCDDGLYRINGKCVGQCHCQYPEQCRVSDGRCTNGACLPGWISDPESDSKCNKQCDNRRWGQGCSQICHCWNNTRCNHINGHCDQGCDTRWYYSPACNNTCRDGEKYLDRSGKCTLDCACTNQKYCRVEHGVCIQGGCKSGAQAGSRCLEPCKKGRYRRATDKNCTETCQCRGDNIPCDDIGGFCPSGCHHRYRGQGCNDTCPGGYFGEDCSGVCHCANASLCHVKDGTCSTGGCGAGYVGTSCQTPCSGNRYGSKCRVPCQCLNDAKCKHTTGECPDRKCNKKYEGENCDREICPPQKYRVNGRCDGVCHCVKISDCDAKTGSCGNATCPVGRRGDKCEHLCHKTYGSDCSTPCHCLDNVQCDTITGACSSGGCDVRHSGQACQTTCPPGKFSPKTNCNGTCRCENDEDCDVIDGYCQGGTCQPSQSVKYYGYACQYYCKLGNYLNGGLCSGVCRCAVAEQCNLVNGSCNGGQCKPGWLGDKCAQECPDRQFGPECSRKCNCKFNKPCKKDYGKCDDGCEDGFQGENCQLTQDHSKFAEQIGVYSGTFIGIGLLAVILGYVAVVKKRRQKRRMQLEIDRYCNPEGEDIGNTPYSRRQSMRLSRSSTTKSAPVSTSNASKHGSTVPTEEDPKEDVCQEIKTAKSDKQGTDVVDETGEEIRLTEESGIVLNHEISKTPVTKKRRKTKGSLISDGEDSRAGDITEIIETVHSSRSRRSSRGRKKSITRGNAADDEIVIDEVILKEATSTSRRSKRKKETNTNVEVEESTKDGNIGS